MYASEEGMAQLECLFTPCMLTPVSSLGRCVVSSICPISILSELKLGNADIYMPPGYYRRKQKVQGVKKNTKHEDQKGKGIIARVVSSDGDFHYEKQVNAFYGSPARLSVRPQAYHLSTRNHKLEQ